MKGSSFDTPGFRRHLERVLSDSVGEYFAKEARDALNRKKEIQKGRSNQWYSESPGWVEEYALVVEHFRAYGGGHGVRVGVRDSGREFSIRPRFQYHGKVKTPLWDVYLIAGVSGHLMEMEHTDNLDSLIQQCVVMAIGEAYLEPELLPEPKPAKVNAKTTKRKG